MILLGIFRTEQLQDIQSMKMTERKKQNKKQTILISALHGF